MHPSGAKMYRDCKNHIDVQKWERIAMYFFVGLPTSPNKRNVIWLIVDRLKKSAYFLEMIMDWSL
ncbi:CCHC-type integrase [Gossypium australe]|uniref:CCHC-type integrase n=1 Tax=Gossypium australe TaxID=47621 RepID=A0A5B6UXU8_9ROSI|nr:CCHC-type integrase [Gossypium australe]